MILRKRRESAWARRGCRSQRKFFCLCGSRQNGGFALLVVIVILLLISFLAGQLILNVRTELKVATNARERAAGLALAQAGINLALFRLLDKPVAFISEEYDTFAEGYEYDDFLAAGHFRYYVVNESGKIDLNSFNRTLMELFLEYMQIDHDEREIIIDSLYDWQDSDNLHRLHGAEQDTYEELDDPYIPRNGKIEDPAEFFLVNGAQVLSGKFRADDIFTTHNSTGLINFNSLTPLMLDFLVEGDDEKKKAYREAQELTPALDRAQALQILGNERFSQVGDLLTYSSNNNKFYTIVSSGEAGVDKERFDQRKNEEGPVPVSHALRVLVEVVGTRVTYYSMEEGWS